jgi:hypothetical protein
MTDAPNFSEAEQLLVTHRGFSSVVISKTWTFKPSRTTEIYLMHNSD